MQGCPNQVSTAYPSHSKEGAAHADSHANAGKVAVCAQGIDMDDRRNRSVLVSMAAGASMIGSHNGSSRHIV